MEGVHEDGADPDLLGDLHAACDGVAEHAASAIGALGRRPIMLNILKNIVAVAITHLTGNAAYSIRAYSPMRRELLAFPDDLVRASGVPVDDTVGVRTAANVEVNAPRNRAA